MLPWKSFVRSTGVVTLLTAGAFAAAQDVMPFSQVSRSISPNAVASEEPPVVDEEAPVVDPADEVGEDATTTTTSTSPDTTTTTAVPDVEIPATEADDAAAPLPTVVEVEEPAKPEAVARKARPVTAPPAQPKDDKGPRPEAAPRPEKTTGDHNCDGHLDNGWHNKVRPVCPTPVPPAERPGGHKPEKGDRPETAPGQVKKNR